MEAEAAVELRGRDSAACVGVGAGLGQAAVGVIIVRLVVERGVKESSAHRFSGIAQRLQHAERRRQILRKIVDEATDGVSRAHDL